MEVVDALADTRHSSVERVAETGQRFFELFVLVDYEQSSRLEQGACEHMPDIVVYLAGYAVSLAERCEAYLVVLSFCEE